MTVLVASYTGSNPTLRGADVTGAWTLPPLQDLLDEWLLAGWQLRPHDALRDPLAPRRVLSPNEKYAALVAAAGYLPLTRTGEDYLELLPVEWRQINAYGIRIDYRTYPLRRAAPRRAAIQRLSYRIKEADKRGVGGGCGKVQGDPRRRTGYQRP